MARKVRHYLPDVPAHIAQYGHNKARCFLDNQDYEFYLDCLQEAKERYQVRLHAYVLLPDRVHILSTPERVDSISKLFQLIGRRYVRYFNTKYKRTGTLWEGRHRSSLIDPDFHVLDCYKYIELYPVKSGLVRMPSKYLWSSHAENCHANVNSWCLLSEHKSYSALGESRKERAENYRELVARSVDSLQVTRIEECLHHCYPMGDTRFISLIEERYDKGLGQLKQGRPSSIGI